MTLSDFITSPRGKSESKEETPQTMNNLKELHSPPAGAEGEVCPPIRRDTRSESPDSYISLITLHLFDI